MFQLMHLQNEYEHKIRCWHEFIMNQCEEEIRKAFRIRIKNCTRCIWDNKRANSDGILYYAWKFSTSKKDQYDVLVKVNYKDECVAWFYKNKTQMGSSNYDKKHTFYIKQHLHTFPKEY